MCQLSKILNSAKCGNSTRCPILLHEVLSVLSLTFPVSQTTQLVDVRTLVSEVYKKYLVTFEYMLQTTHQKKTPSLYFSLYFFIRWGQMSCFKLTEVKKLTEHRTEIFHQFVSKLNGAHDMQTPVHVFLQNY